MHILDLPFVNLSASAQAETSSVTYRHSIITVVAADLAPHRGRKRDATLSRSYQPESGAR
jgi:hypothetical protein